MNISSNLYFNTFIIFYLHKKSCLLQGHYIIVLKNGGGGDGKFLKGVDGVVKRKYSIF